MSTPVSKVNRMASRVYKLINLFIYLFDNVFTHLFLGKVYFTGRYIRTVNFIYLVNKCFEQLNIHRMLTPAICHLLVQDQGK